jgi:23S rRNA pseudouridine2605 synthase
MRKNYSDKGGSSKGSGGRRDNRGGFKKKRFDNDKGEKRSDREEGGFKKERSGDDSSPKKRYSDKPGGFKKKFGDDKGGFKKKFGDDKGGFKKKFGDDKEGFKKRSGAGKVGYKKKSFDDKEEKPFGDKETGAFRKKRFGDSNEKGGYKKTGSFDRPYKKVFRKKGAPSTPYKEKEHDDGSVRLNKYIANAGICSRREADDLIAAGAVSVNGTIITQMGFKVQPGDIVNYGGQTLRQEKMRYVLLNKPKDYITTLDDPQGRKNVMELLRGACRERLYPVGRLDRTTTGVLLFTNDGELTKRLTHPRYGIKKIYHVVLDQNLKRSDFEAIAEGLELEDGPIKPDAIDYTGDANNEVGIEIHSGRNRIVRRIFEHFNYKIIKLDRVYFAGLTKKDLQRGEWRHLEDKEVNMLKITAGSTK